MKLTAKHTARACYLGLGTQAVTNNLPPLLFLAFHNQFGVSLEKIGLLISINFVVQMVVDTLGSLIADRLGARRAMVFAHLCGAAGLALLAFLPYIIEPFLGLTLAVTISAIGGGLIEVLDSPIMDSLPGDEKAKTMSLLHSFYCWGHVAVVLLSTAYFSAFGIRAWRWLALAWTLVPLTGAALFSIVPLSHFDTMSQHIPARALLKNRVFWLFLVLMICSGASEQSISQWSSLFAEAGLGVGKTLGDLLGPCMFAVLMGASRLLYGVIGEKIDVRRGLFLSSLLCIVSYLLAILSPWPLLALAGCALAGFSVGLMWPGTISLAAPAIPAGGTLLYSLLALGGDVGCAAGPGLVGLISGRIAASGGTSEAGLKAGLAFGLIFPILLALGCLMLKRKKLSS